jgi:hypothetical protein
VPPGIVTLECGYLHSKEARGPIGDAFKIEADEDRVRAVLGRVAQHAVVSWSVGPLDVAKVEAFLVALYDEEPGTTVEILRRLQDAERFGRPKLVDPVDLGNE